MGIGQRGNLIQILVRDRLAHRTQPRDDRARPSCALHQHHVRQQAQATGLVHHFLVRALATRSEGKLPANCCTMTRAGTVR
jgi:hypothetical protein